jgi:hypothetical protein
MKFSTWLAALAGVGLALANAGCQLGKKSISFVAPPPPQNYFSGEPIGIPIRRVALLPIYNDKYPQEELRLLDSAFNAELTKKSIFEVVPVSRASMESFFGQRQLESVENLPPNLLAKLRERYGVDGIVFTDITHYSPYRPLAVGVRAKLVDANSGEIRWAFDYIFDSGNPAVAQAAKLYQQRYNLDSLPLPSDGGTVLISPTRFAKFVANQTYVSLTNH